MVLIRAQAGRVLTVVPPPAAAAAALPPTPPPLTAPTPPLPTDGFVVFLLEQMNLSQAEVSRGEVLKLFDCTVVIPLRARVVAPRVLDPTKKIVPWGQVHVRR